MTLEKFRMKLPRMYKSEGNRIVKIIILIFPEVLKSVGLSKCFQNVFSFL